MVASAPGPAMKGKASGNTEMSSRVLASSCSLVVEWVPEVRANTMSSAIRNSRVPPAMRKELREIPMTSKNRAPTKANSTQMTSAIRGFAGHFFLVAGARALRQTGEQGNQRNRFDHDEKNHEEFDELFDHGMLLRAKFTYCANDSLGVE